MKHSLNTQADNDKIFLCTWTHFELLFAVVHLHIQAMGSVPIPIHDVCLAVTVEVGQNNSSSMLHGILHTCSYVVMYSVTQYSLPGVTLVNAMRDTDIRGEYLLNSTRSSHQPAVPHQWRFHLRCSWTGSLVRTRCHRTRQTGSDWQWVRPRHLSLLHSWTQRDEAWS